MKNFLLSLSLLVTAASFAQEIADLDTSFNADPIIGKVYDIQVQNDSKMLVSVIDEEIPGHPARFLNRLNTDGSLDTSFISGTADGSIHAILPLSDGKTFIAGDFLNYNGTPVKNIVKLNSDGSIDTSFNFTANITSESPTGSSGIGDVKMQPDGKILIAGSFYVSNRHNLARLNSNGGVDGSFATPYGGPDYNVNSIVIQPDGKIIIAGHFYHYGHDATLSKIARINADGSFDPTFSPEFYIWGFNIVSKPDGKIIAAGGGNGDQNSVNIFQLNPDGSLDASFNTEFKGNISKAIPLQNGQILICGFFSENNAIERYGVAILNADGSVDTNFNPFTGEEEEVEEFNAYEYIAAIAVQNDGKILIGGSITNYNLTPVNHMARLMGSEELHVNDVISEDSTFKYYPNPVNDILSLNSPTDISQVSVYDMQGREVIAQTWNKATGNINMSSLQSGSYIIKIATKNTTKEVIVIKK